MIRCIAMDLDDTLLSSDLTISMENQAAIRRAVQAGVKVLLASGRMFQSIRSYAQVLGLDIPLIAYNGAIIQEAVSGKILYHRPVPGELAVQLVPLFRAKQIHLNAYLNDQLYMDNLTERGKKYAASSGVTPHPVGDLIPLLKESPHKMLGIASIEEIDFMQSFLERKFPVELFFTRSNPEYLEILAPGVSKANALKEVTSLWGIAPSEVMTIGDAPNDVSMVGWAGVGVAIGNAVHEVKEVAAMVVADHDHDGVAEAIRKVVFGEN
jgi:Cof subfamily protein (haloacid dehalogenase superfamily)